MQKDFEFLIYIFMLFHDDSLYEKFENSIQSFIITFKKLILKLLLKLFRSSHLLITFNYVEITFCKSLLQNTTFSATSLMFQSYHQRNSLSL